ncbi:probable LRR receptor-like serine/threonine-protein kinase At3g47570 [Cornus florida]|uniref:probable LRR receptor-like serine/threonine-protein kinase At3g47570 n=1 Tax=Cornus florida TaxID=4283 RepID=UPI00289B6DF1|nr:probable LRR receptor-like serine/threonine-protein kinase At3g47570 [Cornus florida]
MGNLLSLEEINLSRNHFTGLVPSSFSNITSLKLLILGNNSFTGGIPEEIGNTKLEELVLHFNHLTGPIPGAIFNMSTLRRRLSLVVNQLSGNLPSNIGHSLPNLEGLFLGGNTLSGILPHTISNASNLIKLELSENMFSGSVPNSLGNLARLEYLGIYQNNFISESSSSPELSFLTSLTNCPRLTELQIADNPLNGTLPVSIGNLSSSFETFNATYCGIEGNIPNEIGNLSNLASLYLTGNHLTGFIPISIKGLRKLQRLYLDNNGIVGSIPEVLCQLFNLGLISLSENSLFGLIPECLGNVSSLRYIYLGSNRLTSPIPATLWSLEYLLELNISSNSLSGYLPPEIGSFKVATEIDLSKNQFTGNIPNTIGGLLDIMNLSLANNRLQGPIPDIFRSMVALEFLDLSHNNLSGVIPRSLETLLHLKYFNVSFNKLRGEIPTGGPFANFTNQSFMSNEALCGAPQFQVLPCDTSTHHRSRIKRVLLVLLLIASIFLVLMVAFVYLRCRKKNKTPIQTGSILATERERITYHELLQATDGFGESNLLGIGSFGSVYKGMLIDGTILAVKVFNLQLEGAFETFETECEILRNIRHRNLTKILSSCSNFDFKALILQYMSNGSLEKWLYSHNHFLDILQRLDIMIDVACAIDYLHNGYSTTIVHCDLKPSNVLLDEDMVAHVSDFGIGKFLGDEESITLTETLATFGYIAPEYGIEGLVSTRCDVYSYGIMLMETFTRRKPTDELFAGELTLWGWVKESLPNAAIQVIDSNLLRPKEEDFTTKVQCASYIMELALNCSSESPQERMRMGDVLAALKKIRLWFLANRA